MKMLYASKLFFLLRERLQILVVGHVCENIGENPRSKTSSYSFKAQISLAFTKIGLID
jgi:hypothetical protein